jgi:hypothetical protein
MGRTIFEQVFVRGGMSNFQNPRVPPTGGSHLPHAHPGLFEMRRTVPVPTRGAAGGRQSNLARSRGTCRVKGRCSGRCAKCGQRRGRFFEVKNRPRANPVRGVGGRPGSRNLVAMARFVARCWLRRPCVYLALPNVDSVKIRLPAKVMPVK